MIYSLNSGPEQCKELSWLGTESVKLITRWISNINADFWNNYNLQSSWEEVGSDQGGDGRIRSLSSSPGRISDHEIQTRTITSNLVWSWYRSSCQWRRSVSEKRRAWPNEMLVTNSNGPLDFIVIAVCAVNSELQDSFLIMDHWHQSQIRNLQGIFIQLYLHVKLS